MTDKELQKLGRRELLQLLLQQAKESERLGRELAEAQERLRQMEETYERLRSRLDNKDAQIRELKTTLRTEREKREIDMEDVGSIAEAALKLSGVFDAAQRAADQYLRSIRTLYPAPENLEIPEEPVPEPAEPAAPPKREAKREAATLRETEEKESIIPRPRRSLLRKQQEKGKTTLFFGWQHD